MPQAVRERIALRFNRPFGVYNAGEVAGFDRAYALDLIEQAIAVPIDGNMRGVTPRPPTAWERERDAAEAAQAERQREAEERAAAAPPVEAAPPTEPTEVTVEAIAGWPPSVLSKWLAEPRDRDLLLALYEAEMARPQPRPTVERALSKAISEATVVAPPPAEVSA